jgi:hypothetical protein
MADDMTAPTRSELHICRSCGSPLVHLVDSTEPTPGLWELTLRCPECLEWREVCCPEAALARLDAELCRGIEAVQRELERFARRSFEEDVDRFVRALRAGAILPMDFGAPR